MAFYESPRFPERISMKAARGPSYSTVVVITDSGNEYRDQRWSLARMTYEVSQAAKLPAQYKPLEAFFRAMRGRTHGFRFKDWIDYQVPDTNGTGVFVQLTSTTFQLYKQYTSGSQTELRKITKPVSGTVTWSGTALVGASLNYTTGVLTLTSGLPLTWIGEFDVPCRFGVDEMRGEIVDRNVHEGHIIDWNSIPIIELRRE